MVPPCCHPLTIHGWCLGPAEQHLHQQCLQQAQRMLPPTALAACSSTHHDFDNKSHDVCSGSLAGHYLHGSWSCPRLPQLSSIACTMLLHAGTHCTRLFALSPGKNLGACDDCSCAPIHHYLHAASRRPRLPQLSRHALPATSYVDMYCRRGPVLHTGGILAPFCSRAKRRPLQVTTSASAMRCNSCTLHVLPRCGGSYAHSPCQLALTSLTHCVTGNTGEWRYQDLSAIPASAPAQHPCPLLQART